MATDVITHDSGAETIRSCWLARAWNAADAGRSRQKPVLCIPFEREDLAAKLELVATMAEQERNEWRRRAIERIAQYYSWDAVTGKYEKLLFGLRR